MKSPHTRNPLGCSRSAVGGFTLTELLVVVAIIGLLIALTLPMLGRMRASTKSAACMSNLRQMGAAFRLYAADNQGFLPAVSKNGNADPAKGSLNRLGHWQVEISPYFGRELNQNIQAANNDSDRQAQCPEFEVTNTSVVSRGYGMNDRLTPRGSIQALTNSSNSSNYSYNFRVRAAEIVNPARTIMVADSDSITAGFTPRHHSKVNCVFADGHVSAHTTIEAIDLKTTAIAQ